MRKNTRLTQVLILFLILALAVFVGIYWQLLQNGKQVYEVRSQQVTTLMKNNPLFFERVFDDIFPKTLSCNQEARPDCAQTSRSAFDRLFPLLNENQTGNADFIPHYFGNGTLNLTSRLPMYFIRLEDEKIAKLFFSGDLKLETIDNKEELAVKQVLLGQKEALYGLQANWPGLEMTYLKDFLSEAEVIIPYKKNDKVVGAIVFLHGD